MQNNKSDKLGDELEPHYSEIDTIIDDIIEKFNLSSGTIKYFEACRFKVTALWYLLDKINSLDSKYREYISEHISSNSLQELKLTEIVNGDDLHYRYFPFHEALEFENLLSQGKSCLDCFSKAIGSLYSESPNNIDSLSNVLRSNHFNETTKKMLEIIDESERLHGVIINPASDNKKSIRDLISHRERIDIYFIIRKNQETHKNDISDGALLTMEHDELIRFQNYLVTNISSKIWFLVLGIIQNCSNTILMNYKMYDEKPNHRLE
jgi:hypothetical protein